MLEAIERVLDEEVRPYLRSHAGSVSVDRLEGDTLYVRLAGQCNGCPAADLTTETIIEEAVTQAIPEIRHVALVHTLSEDLLEQARAMLQHKDYEDRQK